MHPCRAASGPRPPTGSAAIPAPAIRLCVAFLLLAAAAAADRPGPPVAAFLDQHCLRCHDARQHKGDFRVDTLSGDLADDVQAQRWAELLLRVTTGEMPPKKEPQPPAGELGAVVEWIAARLAEGRAARMARRGPVAHYRLSREEYANTVYDLLGVRYDPTLPGGLLEDPRWRGFERIGAMLTLSPSHVDRYLKAADEVLRRAFPDRPPAAAKGRRDAIALQGREHDRAALKRLGVEGQVRMVLWPGRRLGDIRPNANGEPVTVRIGLSGLPGPDGRVPHLTVWDQALKRAVHDQDIRAPEERPLVVEFTTTSAHLVLLNDTAGPANEGHTFNVTSHALFLGSRDHRLMPASGRKLVDDAGQALFPLLLVDWVEWDGPVISDEERRRREGLLPDQAASAELAGAALAGFAERAWRRPLRPGEIERYLRVLERERAAGEPMRAASLAAMAGILASKNFIALEEGSPHERRERLDDWELASRLSYFLWGSLPDPALIAAARAGRLRETGGLAAEIARMLADPKVARFTAAFPRQWLQLHRLGQFPPDRQRYPDYDAWLEQSMALEPVACFQRMFADDLPLREFLDSDWTMLNERLARHYGLTAPPASAGPGMQRVALRPADRRGGLLTQAGLLALSSDGTRHRPVHRGAWLLETVFARTPPPPPPNVEPIDAQPPADGAKASIRMQLARHATQPACASCHARIDPLGFAFEHYDGIGRWRNVEVVAKGSGPDPLVDASGVLPDGRRFAGAEDFKRLLVADIDRFAVAFVEQLATFALRRTMTPDDAEALRAIAAAAKADGYRLRALIARFAASDLFRRR